MGEFYSEFGTFHVDITLPKDYTVAASGELLTDSEIKRLNTLASNKTTEQSPADFSSSGSALKTLTFQLDNAHDFAWFADKNFVVDQDSLKLPGSGKTIISRAFYYPEEASSWNRATAYINDAVLFFSKKVGDYPYSHCTAVRGPLGLGGGMEYPGITIIGRTNDSISLNQVIMHEVGHNWFYGVIGSNERAYPFMDEGLTSYYEMQYMLSRYPELELHEFANLRAQQASFLSIDSIPFHLYYFLPYQIAARMNFNQHNLLHSTNYLTYNYFTAVYLKSAFALNYLKEYVGEDDMDRAMQHFYEKWKFKHPYPADFRESLESALDKDISWLFDQVLSTTRTTDYKIGRVKGDSMLIRNSGTVQSPVLIEGLNRNNQPVFSEWHTGFNNQQWFRLPEGDVSKLVLDNKQVTTDMYRKNNFYDMDGFNKTFEPLELKFLVGLEDPSKNTIYYSPVAGWNNYNKTMAGFWLHSGILKKKRVEYQLMPMYGFGNNDLAGSARLNVFFPLQGGIFRNIDISLSGVRYGYTLSDSYNRLTAGIDFLINNNLSKKVFNTLQARYSVASNMEYVAIERNPTPPWNYYYELGYVREQKGRVNPYKLDLRLEAGPKFLKTRLQAEYKVSYTTTGGLNIRLFGGKFITNDNPSSIYHFSLFGKTGVQDYTFDHIFMNRFGDYPEDFFARQFVPAEGGFASFYPGGFSDDWMGAINLTSSIPKIPLVKPFINGAFTKTDRYNADLEFFAEGGLKVGGKIFAVYFPMFSTEEINSYLSDNTSGYWQRVRFVLRLEEINPFRLRELIMFSM
jgi:hypothetical protein